MRLTRILQHPAVAISAGLSSWIAFNFVSALAVQKFELPNRMLALSDATSALEIYLFIMSSFLAYYIYKACSSGNLKLDIGNDDKVFVPVFVSGITLLTLVDSTLQHFFYRELLIHQPVYNFGSALALLGMLVWVFAYTNKLKLHKQVISKSAITNDANKYRVQVCDNFHYMDDEESYTDSEHTDIDSAINRCREIIDANLGDPKTLTPKQIIETWFQFGPDPYCSGSGFSAADYVKEQAFKFGRQSLAKLDNKLSSFRSSKLTISQYYPNDFVVRIDSELRQELVIQTSVPNTSLEMIIDDYVWQIENTPEVADSILESLYYRLLKEGWSAELVR